MPINYYNPGGVAGTAAGWGVTGGTGTGTPGSVIHPAGVPPTTAPPGNVAPAGSFGYNPAYGGIPYVPSPIATQGGALTGNIGNLGSIYGLTTGTAGASAAGARTQIGANLPGYGPMTQTASGNILSELHGQIPQDVVNQLAEQAAERGVGFGAGAPTTNASLLRALGLTSLGLMEQGNQDLTGAIGRTPVGPAVNPSGFLVSPEQVQGAATAANLYGAAPIPEQAAAAGIAAAGTAPTVRAPGIGGGGGAAPFGGAPLPTAAAAPLFGTAGPTGTVSSQPSASAYQNWNDWYNSLFGGGNTTGGGPGEFAGMSPEDAMFYNTYGMFAPGSETGGNAAGAQVPGVEDYYGTGPYD